MNVHTMRFDGAVLARGFWLYVWRVDAPDRLVFYVGRTGDSSSVNAQSPFRRVSEHMDPKGKATRSRSNSRLAVPILTNPKTCAACRKRVGQLPLGHRHAEEGSSWSSGARRRPTDPPAAPRAQHSAASSPSTASTGTTRARIESSSGGTECRPLQRCSKKDRHADAAGRSALSSARDCSRSSGAHARPSAGVDPDKPNRARSLRLGRLSMRRPPSRAGTRRIARPCRECR